MAAGVKEGKSMTDKIDNNRRRSPDPKPKNDHLGRQMHNLESPGSSAAASHTFPKRRIVQCVPSLIQTARLSGSHPRKWGQEFET